MPSNTDDYLMARLRAVDAQVSKRENEELARLKAKRSYAASKDKALILVKREDPALNWVGIRQGRWVFRFRYRNRWEFYDSEAVL